MQAPHYSCWVAKVKGHRSFSFQFQFSKILRPTWYVVIVYIQGLHAYRPFNKGSHPTAFCSRGHLPVTPAKLMRPGIDQNASCTVDDFA